MSTNDSDFDFSYFVDTTHALNESTIDLESSYAITDHETSQDSSTFPLLADDITLRRGQRLDLESKSPTKPSHSISSTDRAPIFKLAKASSTLTSVLKKPSCGTEHGANQKTSATKLTNMQANTCVNDSLTPGAISHTSAPPTEGPPKRMGASSKDYVYNLSTLAAASLPPNFTGTVEKQTSKKTNVKYKRHTADNGLCLPAAVPCPDSVETPVALVPKSHTPTKAKCTSTKSKGHGDGLSAAVSYPPIFRSLTFDSVTTPVTLMPKSNTPTKAKCTSTKSKGRGDGLSAAVSHPPVFKSPMGFSESDATPITSTPKPPVPIDGANTKSKGRVGDLLTPPAVFSCPPKFESPIEISDSEAPVTPTPMVQASPRRKGRVVTSQRKEALSNPVGPEKLPSAHHANMPYTPPVEGTSVAALHSRSKPAARSASKRHTDSDFPGTKSHTDPVQMHTSVHAHENGVTVTNNFYLLTADSFATAKGQQDAGTNRITAEINKILEGTDIHAMAVDEVWNCIYQLKGYEPTCWLAILAKCGINKDRWPGLLHIMHMASRDYRIVDRFVSILFPELSINVLISFIALVPSHTFAP